MAAVEADLKSLRDTTNIRIANIEDALLAKAAAQSRFQWGMMGGIAMLIIKTFLFSGAA